MLKDKKKLVIAIMAIVIVVGMIITATKGLKYDLVYSKNQKMNIYVETGFNINDIKEIVKEVFGNKKTYVQTGSTNENIVIITAKTISEKQQDKLITKINEKYGIELNKDEDVNIVKNAKVRGRDIVKPYIMSTFIAIAIILIYIAIKYKKIGVLKSSGIVLGATVLIEALYLSILAITRLPINKLTMPIALLLLLITISVATFMLEKRLRDKKAQKND